MLLCIDILNIRGWRCLLLGKAEGITGEAKGHPKLMQQMQVLDAETCRCSQLDSSGKT